MRHAFVQVRGRVVFPVLVPETERERQIGMNHGCRAPFVGMAFRFDPPTLATMTMEQTPRALFICFVGPDGHVHQVNGAPAFSGLHRSGRPVSWVIETTARILVPGDMVVVTEEVDR